MNNHVLVQGDSAPCGLEHPAARWDAAGSGSPALQTGSLAERGWEESTGDPHLRNPPFSALLQWEVVLLPHVKVEPEPCYGNLCISSLYFYSIPTFLMSQTSVPDPKSQVPGLYEFASLPDVLVLQWEELHPHCLLLLCSSEEPRFLPHLPEF